MSGSSRLRHFLLLAVLLGSCLAAPAQAGPAAALGVVQEARPGPWGRLEYSRIVIEPPEEFMPTDYGYRNFAVWNFAGYTPERLQALWQSAGLPPDLQQALNDRTISTSTPEGITLRPSGAIVRRLDPSARARIYNVLAGLPDNPIYQMPFRFRRDMVDEWLTDDGLPAHVLRDVRQLLYQRGNSVLFSDPDLVLPLLPDAAGRVHLIKTLSRKSALLVRLRLGPADDIEALADYWGRGPRRKDVKPLLQSLARHPQGMTLDIVHLLPRFARGLVYTYPPRTEPLDPTFDCHWTTMNFFRDEADPRFADLAEVVNTLRSEYDFLPPEVPRGLGDVLLLVRPSGQIVHSCVFVADDIVFTKNGYSYQMPWTLSTVEDMLAAYPDEPDLSFHAFRRRD